MKGRKSDVFFLWIGVGILCVGLLFAHARYRQGIDVPIVEENRRLVKRLGITDLCLFTDARYTRHPVMADLNTPFQDYPMSFEHFPSASLLTVPPHLAKREPPSSERDALAQRGPSILGAAHASTGAGTATP